MRATERPIVVTHQAAPLWSVRDLGLTASSVCAALSFCVMLAPAAAICLNPFGCGPSTYQDCVNEATKRPTSLGVNVAMQQCHDKFKAAELARSAKADRERAEALATRWTQLDFEHATAESLQRELGDPYLVFGPRTCTKVKGKSAPGARTICYTHVWQDERPGRVNAYFKVEVQDLQIPNYHRQSVWAWWQNSGSI